MHPWLALFVFLKLFLPSTSFANTAGSNGSKLPAAPVISKTVGSVGDHVLTSREVQIYYFFEQALKSRTIDPEFGLNSQAFKAQLSESLLEWMVYLESKSFPGISVTAKERQDAETLLSKAIRSSPEVAQFWKDLEVSVDKKTELLEKKLRSKKFLQFRDQSSFVEVTDRDALNYFQKNRTKFAGMGFEKFKDSIKTFLSQEQSAGRMKEWLSVLQRKYSVRQFGLDK